jgi:hypothetical protein
MSAGLIYSATDVNNNIGNQMRQLHVTLGNLHVMHQWYLALGAGGLTQSPYLMSAADDANIGSALSDAEQLYQLFNNNGTLAAAKDFTVFMGRLWGFGF